MTCDLCGSSHATFLFRKAGYGYARCEGCGLIGCDLELEDPTVLYDGLFEQEWLEREIRRTIRDPRKQRSYAEQVRRRLPGPSPGRVLDVGCGVGGFLLAARGLGHDVAGIEVSAVASAYARETLELPVETRSVETWDGSGTFDLARVNAFLEHVHHPGHCLRAVARSLRPGGIVFGLTLNAASWTFRRAGIQWRYVGMGGHVKLFTPTTLRRYLEESGFERVRIWTTGFRAEPRGWPGPLENLVGRLAGLAGKGHRLYFEGVRASRGASSANSGHTPETFS